MMKIYNMNNIYSKKNRINFISENHSQNEMTFRKAAGGEDMFEISSEARNKFYEANILDFKKIREQKEKEEQRNEIMELILEEDRKTSSIRKNRIKELKEILNNGSQMLEDQHILSETSYMLGSLFFN